MSLGSADRAGALCGTLGGVLFLALFSVNLLYLPFVIWDAGSFDKRYCVAGLEAGVTVLLAWLHVTKIALGSKRAHPPSRPRIAVRTVTFGLAALAAVVARAARSDAFVPVFGLAQIVGIAWLGSFVRAPSGPAGARWRAAAKVGIFPAAAGFVLLLELMNRTWCFGLYRADPDTVVSLRENRWYGVNRAGFRGPELTAAKPAGTRRVLFLGDSSVFGLGARWDETFAARTASCLAARERRPVEAINGGVPGFNLRDDVRRWRNLQRYDPDVAVVMDGFHFRSVAGQLDRRALTQARAARIGPWLDAFARFGITFVTPPAVVALLKTARAGDQPDRRETAAYVEALSDLAALAEAHRIPLVFVQYPSALVDPRAPFLIGRFARSRGIPVVDPRPLFTPEDRMADELHPVASGHAKIAALLCDRIKLP